MARPPDFNSLVQLAMKNRTQEDGSDIAQNVEGSGWAILAASCDNPFGMQIVVKNCGNDVGQSRKATVGGKVQWKGKYFYLTVAHAFQSEMDSLPPAQPGDYDSEYEIDGQSEAGGNRSEDEDDVEFTSRGSLTPDCAGSEHDGSFGNELSPASTLSDSSSVMDRTWINDARGTATSRRGYTTEPARLATSYEPLTTTRDIFVSSSDGQSLSLDYALIEICKPQHRTFNRIQLGDGVVYPEHVVSSGPRDAEILTVTGSRGLLTGHLSGTPSFMCLPHTNTYQEVYTVRLTAELEDGDCGSWIVDAQSGDLYGHIVAGSPETGIAYLIPSSQVFKNTEERLGFVLKLPTKDGAATGEVDSRRSNIPLTITFMERAASEVSSSDSDVCQEDESLGDTNAFLVKSESEHCRVLEPVDVAERAQTLYGLSTNNVAKSSDGDMGQVIVSHTTAGTKHGASECHSEEYIESFAKDLTERFRRCLSKHHMEQLNQLRSRYTHPSRGSSSSHPSTVGTSPPPIDPPVQFDLPSSDLATDIIVPPRYSWLNIPQVPVPPTDTRSLQFRDTLHTLSNIPVKWEIPYRLDEALLVVPLAEIYTEADEESHTFQAEAESVGKMTAWGYQDCVIRALLRWYRRSFFTWVNTPPCSGCYSPTALVGLAAPTPDEQARSAHQVELYRCLVESCGGYERFPRYNDAFVLLQTRRGRIGEWANCFGMLCRAVGSRVRWVWNSEDHVWTEVYSVHRKRWIHVDACEGVWNQPRLYTEGWGRKLAYCIAFSADGAMDVTRRYVRKPYKHGFDRIRCPEAVLLYIMDEIRAMRRADLSKQDKFRLEGEDTREQAELRACITLAIASELCNIKVEDAIRESASPSRTDADAQKAREIMKHRQSGSAEWLHTRGEGGTGASGHQDPRDQHPR